MVDCHGNHIWRECTKAVGSPWCSLCAGPTTYASRAGGTGGGTGQGRRGDSEEVNICESWQRAISSGGHIATQD